MADSRPLCPNSDNPRDTEPLTLQRPAITIPPGEFDDADLFSRNSWRQSQIRSDHFWKHWLRKYMPTLQLKQKWLTTQRNLSIGDLVILVDEKQCSETSNPEAVFS